MTSQSRASLMAQAVKKLSAMRETQVQSLGQEDPFKRGIYTDLTYLQNNHLWLFSQQIMSNSLTAAHRASLSFTISQSLLKFMSLELVLLSNHIILCSNLLILASIFPSIRVFFNESVLCIKWPNYWSFSFSPSNECSELISFSIHWFDLLAVQRTLKNLLQHHSLKASILQYSALLMVQLSHPYVTTGKTTALTIWIFVGKVMSLFFNKLSRFVIAILPRSNHLIFWLKSRLQWFWSLPPFLGDYYWPDTYAVSFILNNNPGGKNKYYPYFKGFNDSCKVTQWESGVRGSNLGCPTPEFSLTLGFGYW